MVLWVVRKSVVDESDRQIIVFRHYSGSEGPEICKSLPASFFDQSFADHHFK